MKESEDAGAETQMMISQSFTIYCKLERNAERFRKLERIQRSRGPLWYWVRKGLIYAHGTKGTSDDGKFYRSLRAAVDAAPEPQTFALPAKPDQPNSGEAA